MVLKRVGNCFKLYNIRNKHKPLYRTLSWWATDTILLCSQSRMADTTDHVSLYTDTSDDSPTSVHELWS